MWRLIAVGASLIVVIYLLEMFLLDVSLPERHLPRPKSLNPRIPRNLWYIGTSITATAFQRRMIIRNTWQKLYYNDTIITNRFIISNPGDLWAPIIAAENSTYGDIILLPHIEDSKYTANTYKTLEFLKVLTAGSQRWSFVSKIDDDSFLDAHNFYKDYLQPLLKIDAMETHVKAPASTNRTIIARTLHRDGWTLPGGQFYTMSWDIVKLLTDLYKVNPIHDEAEDVLVGRLLHEASESWTHIDLPNHVAFDYEAKELFKEGKAYAAKGADLSGWSHAVGPGALNPHKMKTDEDYLKVAACFDQNGLIDPGWAG